MKKLLSVLAFSALLTACGNNEDGSAPEQSEVITSDGNENDELTMPVAFPELFARLEEQDTSFFAEAFGDFAAPAPLDTAGSVPGKMDELSQYRRFFIFNNDSTRAIDPYSYGYLLVERGGKERLVPGSPDTEVAMVDLATGVRRRLLYFGPSYMLLDARWKGRDTVMFALTEAIADNKISPEIWEVDLASMTTRIRRYPDTLTVDLEQYRAQKLDSASY